MYLGSGLFDHEKDGSEISQKSAPLWLWWSLQPWCVWPPIATLGFNLETRYSVASLDKACIFDLNSIFFSHDGAESGSVQGSSDNRYRGKC